MKVAIALLCFVAGTALAAQPDYEGATYTCNLKHRFDGDLYLSQTLTEQGRQLSAHASWVQPGALHDRKRPEHRDIDDPGYMTIRVDTKRATPEGAPAFAMGDAQVQLTVVTRKRLKGSTVISFHSPARSFENYEPAIMVAAHNSRGPPWTIVSLPYRVLDSYAGGDRVLDWTLLRHIGGDGKWTTIEDGRFDLRKVTAFAAALDAAAPALAEMRRDYRSRCQFTPAADPSEHDTL